MKMFKSILLSMLIVFLLTSCYRIKVPVGNGGAAIKSESQFKWYVFGLIPLNDTDPKLLIPDEEVEDYTVTTGQSVTSVFLNWLVVPVSLGIVGLEAVEVTW